MASAALLSPPLKFLLHPELGKGGVILQSLVGEAVPGAAPAQFRVEGGQGDLQGGGEVLDRHALLPELLELLPGLESGESVACHDFTSFLAKKISLPGARFYNLDPAN